MLRKLWLRKKISVQDALVNWKLGVRQLDKNDNTVRSIILDLNMPAQLKIQSRRLLEERGCRKRLYVTSKYQN